MSTSGHAEIRTRPLFRVLSAVLALLSLAVVPLLIYCGLTEGGGWLAWGMATVVLFNGAIFAGGAFTGEWLRFRKQ